MDSPRFSHCAIEEPAVWGNQKSIGLPLVNSILIIGAHIKCLKPDEMVPRIKKLYLKLDDLTSIPEFQGNVGREAIYSVIL